MFLDFSLSSPVVKLQELKIPSLVFKLWGFDCQPKYDSANTAAAMSTLNYFLLDTFFGAYVNMDVQINLPFFCLPM